MRTVPARRMSILAVAALCGSVALTGCGKSSHSAAASSTAASAPTSQPAGSAQAPAAAPAQSSAAPVTSSAPAAATSPPPASSAPPATSPPPDPQLLAINLQAADLPGWTSSGDTSTTDDAANSAALAKCVGGRDTYPDLVADVVSPDYALGNASLSSDASRYRSQADLASDLAILKSPKVSSCYTQVVRGELVASLPGGTELNSVSIVVTPGSAGIRSNVVATAEGKISYTMDGQATDRFLNVAFITGPLIEADVQFFNTGAPLPATTRNALVAKVAVRAAGGKAS